MTGLYSRRAEHDDQVVARRSLLISTGAGSRSTFHVTSPPARLPTSAIDDPEQLPRLPKVLLYELIDRYLAGQSGDVAVCEAFCHEFEYTFNLRVDKATFSNPERDVFDRLSDVVAWFSPLLEERAEYPGFKGPEQVHAAVLETREALGGPDAPTNEPGT